MRIIKELYFMIKICAGAYKGRKLKVYDGGEVRPTTDQLRQSIFNILLNRMYLDLSDHQVLDLYAGTGGLGIEAISRGADFCHFVERDAKTASILVQNINSIDGLSAKTKVYPQDCLMFLQQAKAQSFDLLFCDPPYKAKNSIEILKKLSQSNALKEDGVVVFEHLSKDEFEVDGDWHLYLRRSYGDSSISICVKTKSNWLADDESSSE
jgi:16S rRNA (guanine(966)-N(2))-methyltransferase RsmD